MSAQAELMLHQHTATTMINHQKSYIVLESNFHFSGSYQVFTIAMSVLSVFCCHSSTNTDSHNGNLKKNSKRLNSTLTI